jgi:hypothetical protein
VAPRVVDAQVKVFAGLRHLGFRERDVRAVLAELLADDELRDATAERLLREALRSGQSSADASPSRFEHSLSRGNQYWLAIPGVVC